ncbi:transcriptional repressor LexA [Serpentinicella alkaliphila]|uniref:LexA repressor n=1 Tax=Serpentinicella alkaliphila TaxID=1734049 RepID=A0A4R2SY85_9FIRM|nr:transcriptional repressor LexA [Serpentinicella alkaliphila]QUH26504.1 transcriptional repressor LexA [Serpentinicella alkaliphila]TCP95499.1 SOS-response transcriptional repressor LexA [Serpentinicella alkaliphila]
MYDDLSNKQLQVLSFLKSELKSKGYPPSVREICQSIGIKSTSTVHGYLSKLEERGYIRRDPTKPRAIEILDSINDTDSSFSKEMVNIPIVGKVTAGNPILAVENIEDTFPMPTSFIGNNDDDLFILSVKGESMIEAAILDDDYIVVKKQSHASNGDIVVALIEEEATVKRFFKEKGCIRLQPENSFMDPIYVKDVSILGKVVGVFRKM